MRGGFAFEESHPPLVVARLWGSLTDDEFRSYLRGYDTIMTRESQVVVIIDARTADPAPASQRKIQADWIASHETQIRSLLLGIAFVLASPIVRAIITAVFWLRPLPCPHVITGTMQEALTWARKTCESHGIPFPASSLSVIAVGARKSERPR